MEFFGGVVGFLGVFFCFLVFFMVSVMGFCSFKNLIPILLQITGKRQSGHELFLTGHELRKYTCKYLLRTEPLSQKSIHSWIFPNIPSLHPSLLLAKIQVIVGKGAWLLK